MPNFIPCHGVAEVAIQTVGVDGDIGVNKLYVYGGVDTAWSEASLVNLANTIDAWLEVGGGAGQKYVDSMSSTAHVQSLNLRDLTTEYAFVQVKAVNHAGTDSAADLQAGITKACTLRTGHAGRSFRGRLFMPWLTEAWPAPGDVNSVDPTKLANLVAMWSSLMAAVPAGDSSWSWGVLSRYSGVDPVTKKPIPRAAGIITPITEVGYSHTAFDYQRRRAPFHARHG